MSQHHWHGGSTLDWKRGIAAQDRLKALPAGLTLGEVAIDRPQTPDEIAVIRAERKKTAEEAEARAAEEARQAEEGRNAEGAAMAAEAAKTEQAAKAKAARPSCSGGFLADLLCSAGMIDPDLANALDKAHANLGNPIDPITGALFSPTIDEITAEVSRQLHILSSQYKIPDKLFYKKSSEIAFVLETQGPGSGNALLDTIPGKAVSVQVKASNVVHDKLSGALDKVTITLHGGDGAERQVITSVAPV